jgi:nucleotide-binding universal stress UspA family protein
MITVEHILCLTDLSPTSNQALRYAIALAWGYDARLTICHCLEPSRYADPAVREQTHAQIETAISKYYRQDGTAPPPWEALVIEGDPTIDIAPEAVRWGVDLIVLQSRRRPLAARIFGSTAEAICRSTSCPVLVTHADEHEWTDSADGEFRINRVLIAHDFSPNADAAFVYALSLAQDQQAELHLVHVIEPPREDLPFTADLIEEAHHKLRQVMPGDAELWSKVTKVLRAGQPYGEVLAYAVAHEIDLICIGKHGEGGGRLTLFGSNTDRVLRQATCPVLVAPAVGVAQAQPALTEPAELALA